MKNEFDWLVEENDDVIMAAEFGVSLSDGSACVCMSVEEGFLMLTVDDLERILKILKD